MSNGAWGADAWNASAWDGPLTVGVSVGRTVFASTGRSRGIDPGRSTSKGS